MGLGGISIYQILIIIIFVGSFYLAIKLLKRLSFVERWLASITIKRYLYDYKQYVGGAPRLVETSPIPLPLGQSAVYFVPALMAVVWSGSSSEILTSGIGFLVIVVSISAALYLHITGRGNRKKKYTLLMVGLSLPAAIALKPLLNIALLLGDPATSEALISYYFILWIGGLACVIYITGFCLHLWRIRVEKLGYAVPTSGMRRFYGMIVSVGFPLAVLAVVTYTSLLLLVYLPVRYTLGEWMRKLPILYLRSFSFSDGPDAFGQIVARVAGRYGVVKTLVHRRQTPPELQSDTRLTDRPVLASVDDSQWRDWVQKELRDCAVAIVDTSGNTRGVLWELAESRKVLGDDKVIELVDESTTAASKSDYSAAFRYSLDKKSVREVRKEVGRRLKSALIL